MDSISIAVVVSLSCGSVIRGDLGLVPSTSPCGRFPCTFRTIAVPMERRLRSLCGIVISGLPLTAAPPTVLEVPGMEFNGWSLINGLSGSTAVVEVIGLANGGALALAMSPTVSLGTGKKLVVVLIFKVSWLIFAVALALVISRDAVVVEGSRSFRRSRLWR